MSHRHEHGSRNCHEVFARLSEYIDGELPENLCEMIDGHMQDCEPCVAFLDSLRRTVDWIGGQDRAKMPDDLREAVCEAYRKFIEDSKQQG